jgi:hypothetical protein
MLGNDRVIKGLADTLERHGAPLSPPEDWVLLCDDYRLNNVSRATAKSLLARAKKETARRWLHAHFEHTEMEMDLINDCEYSEDTDIYDERILKRRAIAKIDDVVSTVAELRRLYTNRSPDSTQSQARQATVAARVAYGYSEEKPVRIDCFAEDLRRQCLRLIRDIYANEVNSARSLVYFISIDNQEFVKIGFTSCLEKRLKSLRTASHAEPTIHLTLGGTRSMERELHKRFEAARYNREWFRMTNDIKAFIASSKSSEGRALEASSM